MTASASPGDTVLAGIQRKGATETDDQQWLVCPAVHHVYLAETLNNLTRRNYVVRWILDAGVSSQGATVTVVAEKQRPTLRVFPPEQRAICELDLHVGCEHAATASTLPQGCPG